MHQVDSSATLANCKTLKKHGKREFVDIAFIAACQKPILPKSNEEYPLFDQLLIVVWCTYIKDSQVCADAFDRNIRNYNIVLGKLGGFGQERSSSQAELRLYYTVIVSADLSDFKKEYRRYSSQNVCLFE